jgi:hypothetical protein
MQRFWARGVLLLILAPIIFLPAAANARLAVANVGLAAHGSTLVDEDYIVFAVAETSQGKNLNGDGDTADLVLHVFDVETGTTNLGLAVFGPFAVDDARLIFTVDEMSQGKDLNEDGDVNDLVLHVFNVKTRRPPINLGLDAIDGFEVGKDWIAFTVDEWLQGETDLNEDGDIDDLVLHVFGMETRTLINVGWNASGGFEVGKDWIAFAVHEGLQGEEGTDLNGDDDASDFVLHVFDVKTGTTTNVRQNVALPSFGSFTADKEQIAFTVDEKSQGGTDLNGDGDGDDVVLHIVEP